MGRIIEIGKKHQEEFEENLYLHNSTWTYVGESKPFNYIDIKIINKIIKKIINQQKAQEQNVLKRLNCNLVELNNIFQSFITEKGFLETVQNSQNIIDNIINNSVNQNFANIENLYRNINFEKKLKNSILNTINTISNEEINSYNNLIYSFDREGLSDNFINLFNEYRILKKGKRKMANDFIKQVSNDINNYYYSIAIDNTNQLIEEIFKGQTKNTHKKFNSSIQINKKIQNRVKRISISDNRKIGIKINSSLEDFYKKISLLSKNSNINLQQIEELNEKFQTNNFKYHLIHQAVLYANQKKNIGNQSNITKTLLNFIKSVIPLYIAIDFLKDSNTTNFLIIEQRIVPFSEILNKIFYSNIFKPNINLQYNGNINMTKMLREKKSIKVESIEDYYNPEEIKIGADYGQEAYSQISLTTLNLSNTLKNML